MRNKTHYRNTVVSNQKASFVCTIHFISTKQVVEYEFTDLSIFSGAMLKDLCEQVQLEHLLVDKMIILPKPHPLFQKIVKTLLLGRTK